MIQLLTVNEDLCVACGKCVRVCPVRVIVINDATAKASVDAEKLCINCGRCVDNCKVGALYHRYRKSGYRKRRS